MEALMSGIKKDVKMSRETILNSIKKNKPEVLPMPEIDEAIFHEDIDLKETFKNWVALVGGTVIEVDSKKVDSEIMKCYPNKTNIVSTTKKSSLGTIQIDKD